jgi:hypothetical protein
MRGLKAKIRGIALAQASGWSPCNRTVHEVVPFALRLLWLPNLASLGSLVYGLNARFFIGHYRH